MFRIYTARPGCHWSLTNWIWQVDAISPSAPFHSCEENQEYSYCGISFEFHHRGPAESFKSSGITAAPKAREKRPGDEVDHLQEDLPFFFLTQLRNLSGGRERNCVARDVS